MVWKINLEGKLTNLGLPSCCRAVGAMCFTSHEALPSRCWLSWWIVNPEYGPCRDDLEKTYLTPYYKQMHLLVIDSHYTDQRPMYKTNRANLSPHDETDSCHRISNTHFSYFRGQSHVGKIHHFDKMARKGCDWFINKYLLTVFSREERVRSMTFWQQDCRQWMHKEHISE